MDPIVLIASLLALGYASFQLGKSHKNVKVDCAHEWGMWERNGYPRMGLQSRSCTKCGFTQVTKL